MRHESGCRRKGWEVGGRAGWRWKGRQSVVVGRWLVGGDRGRMRWVWQEAARQKIHRREKPIEIRGERSESSGLEVDWNDNVL